MSVPAINVGGVPRKLDYIVSRNDSRDYVFGDSDSALPAVSGLSTYTLPVNRIEDQGSFGACTAFAVTSAFERLVAAVVGTQNFQGSPLFNYSNSRILDADVLENDGGTTLRSACSNLRLVGICGEAAWPYNYLNFATTPSRAAYDEARALAGTVNYYELIRSVPVFKTVLSGYKVYITVGIQVYAGYESADTQRTGDIPDAAFDTEAPIGGHAVNIYGFDDTKRRFLIINQYGTGWGAGGTGTISYDYIMNATATPEAKIFLPSENFGAAYAAFDRNTATKDGGKREENGGGGGSCVLKWTKRILILLFTLFLIAAFLLFMLRPLNLLLYRLPPAIRPSTL